MIVAGPGQTSDLTHETNILTEMKVNVASYMLAYEWILLFEYKEMEMRHPN